jgi:hypothetical protein
MPILDAAAVADMRPETSTCESWQDFSIIFHAHDWEHHCSSIFEASAKSFEDKRFSRPVLVLAGACINAGRPWLLHLTQTMDFPEAFYVICPLR